MIEAVGALHICLATIRTYSMQASLAQKSNIVLDKALLIQNIHKRLSNLSEYCIVFEMNQTRAFIYGISKMINDSASFDRISAFLQSIYQVAEDEGRTRSVYYVKMHKSLFYKAECEFVSIIANSFPDAVIDVKAAIKCYAVDENTACVFHLMRVLEHGIKAVSADVGLTFDKQQWYNIFNEIEKKIKDERALGVRNHERGERLKFLSEAAKEFAHFKDGWRNHVSHNRAVYDEYQAHSVYDHVKSFMIILASNLKTFDP